MVTEPVSVVLELGGGACVYGDGACVYGDRACVYGNHSILRSPQVPCPFWDFFGTFWGTFGTWTWDLGLTNMD